MKRVFSILTIAMVTVVAFAYTIPKSAFAQTYHFNRALNQWQQDPGDSCPGNVSLCEYTSNVSLTVAQRATVASKISGNSNQTVFIDIDNDGQEDDPVNVSDIKRFND